MDGLVEAFVDEVKKWCDEHYPQLFKELTEDAKAGRMGFSDKTADDWGPRDNLEAG